MSNPLFNFHQGAEAYSVQHREFDAVNAEVRRRINDADERREAQYEALRDDFIRMLTAPKLTDAEQARVNKVLEDNVTGDVIHALVRAVLCGHQTHAFALATNIREDQATYFADVSED